jgi:hypothetical protein
MKRHPLSAAFPDMDPTDFASLVADIEKNGLREHGWVFEGMILDGWHRYRACEESGVRFRWEQYDGTDPIGFVRSRNLERRHLTPSQRAAAIVACHAWRPEGRPKKLRPGDGVFAVVGGKWAKQAGVGTITIERAKAAHKAGLGKAVRDGAMSAKTAADLAKGRDPQAKRADPKDRKIAELEARVAELEEELEQVRDGAAEAVEAAEAAQQMLKTDAGVLVLQLRAEIASLTRSRDDALNQVGELVRQNKMLQRKLDKAMAA